MKMFAIVPLALFASSSFAGFNGVVARVPEPEMWALLGVAAAAFGAARLLKKKSRK